jgi:hypothetical protein
VVEEDVATGGRDEAKTAVRDKLLNRTLRHFSAPHKRNSLAKPACYRQPSKSTSMPARCTMTRRAAKSCKSGGQTFLSVENSGLETPNDRQDCLSSSSCHLPATTIWLRFRNIFQRRVKAFILDEPAIAP